MQSGAGMHSEAHAWSYCAVVSESLRAIDYDIEE
jgi:hypothetical protein